MVESAWGAVPGLLLARFPKPLAEPGVPVSEHPRRYPCHQPPRTLPGQGQAPHRDDAPQVSMWSAPPDERR